MKAVPQPCPIQLLNVRRLFDRTEAVLSWVPDPELGRAAEGAELNMSSHVLDAITGRVLMFDGPRARTCLGPEKNLCVLELPIVDDAPCRIEIEPVAEMRFWASDRGHAKLVLECEHTPDGSVVVDCPATGQRFVVRCCSNKPFRIDSTFYGLGDSERCVEIPWALSRYRGEVYVLDVGHARAQKRYIEARNALAVPVLVGVDPSAAAQDGIRGVAGDVLWPPFRQHSFDLIIAISVIEHVGCDNSRYFHRRQPAAPCDDLEAGQRLATLLRNGGRMLITVPFGRFEEHGWFVQYDQHRLKALVEATGLELVTAEYYGAGSSGWVGPLVPETLSETTYQGDRAGAVACIEMLQAGR